MARVTVEDCLKNVKNRFELVMIAAKRARQLMRGKDAKVEWDNDKSTVVALREIAAGYTDFSQPDARDEDDEPLNLAPVEKPAEKLAEKSVEKLAEKEIEMPEEKPEEPLSADEHLTGTTDKE